MNEKVSMVVAALLSERSEKGYWEGHLSSSALSTATATIALALAPGNKNAETAAAGAKWLAQSSNDDGGWGDTPDSPSNLTATLLSRTALASANMLDTAPTISASIRKAISGADKWLGCHSGINNPPESSAELAAAVNQRYGDDKTFSAPILMAIAAARDKTTGKKSPLWRHIARFPFGLALLPSPLLAATGIPVVSYAIPALVSIGVATATKNPSKNPLRRTIDTLSTQPALRLLEQIQPSNGGFLEAIPLTSFVAISLIASAPPFASAKNVVERCLDFIRRSVRADGSWPIDTNLATWLTSLTVTAVGAKTLDRNTRRDTLKYLLGAQQRKSPQRSGAPPGGWAWTHLPGSVPDADDTAAAIIALNELAPDNKEAVRAAASGARWLMWIQNRDGGVPTFRKGWGRLEFDKSCPDITAHAVTALSVFTPRIPSDSMRRRVKKFIAKALRYLERSQQKDGSWIPLWFGSQHPNNPATGKVFGSAMVTHRLSRLDSETTSDNVIEMVSKSSAFIAEQRNPDMGWGWSPTPTPPFKQSSIEETAMAAAALQTSPEKKYRNAAEKAIVLLDQAFANSAPNLPAPTPMGLYFASLWYSEKLYPAIFTAIATGVGTGTSNFSPVAEPPPDIPNPTTPR